MEAKKETFIEVLKRSMGNVSKACKACKISRFCYYNWLKTDNEFKEACENISEYLLDFTEDALFSLIKKKDKTAIIFYLKTRGKGRGYVERQEIEHKDTPTFIMYDARNKTDDED